MAEFVRFLWIYGRRSLRGAPLTDQASIYAARAVLAACVSFLISMAALAILVASP